MYILQIKNLINKKDPSAKEWFWDSLTKVSWEILFRDYNMPI